MYNYIIIVLFIKVYGVLPAATLFMVYYSRISSPNIYIYIIYKILCIII